MEQQNNVYVQDNTRLQKATKVYKSLQKTLKNYKQLQKTLKDYKKQSIDCRSCAAVKTELMLNKSHKKGREYSRNMQKHDKS